MSFKDYFSTQARDYARYRPDYPAELFIYLAGLVEHHETVWDCATGNGQIASGLTPYFRQIFATDASAKQIAQAFQHEQIHYSVAQAEDSGLPSGMADLITVGQALHWFDLDAFYREVRRVAKPDGAIAIIGYGYFELPQISAPISQAIDEFYALIEPHWTPERQIVEARYQTVPFPFVEIATPDFWMTANWTADDLMGYLCTWSATQHYITQNGEDAIADLTERLQTAWVDPTIALPIRWQIFLRIGYLAS
jgi:SAM-dependent methyltransferase